MKNLLFTLCALLCGATAQATDTITFTMNVQDVEIYYPILLDFEGNRASIHWGDGQKTNLSQNNKDYDNEHTYKNTGTYNVMIVGANAQVKLTELNLSQLGAKVSQLDVSKAKSLKKLDVNNQNLNALDLSQNTDLEFVYCAYNKLTELNISGLNKLKHLNSEYNQISNLVFDENTNPDAINLKYNVLPLSKQEELIQYFSNINLDEQALFNSYTATTEQAIDLKEHTITGTSIVVFDINYQQLGEDDGYYTLQDDETITFHKDGVYTVLLSKFLPAKGKYLELRLSYVVGHLPIQEIRFTTTDEQAEIDFNARLLRPYSVDWGDGQTDTLNNVPVYHDYTKTATYEVVAKGLAPDFNFGDLYLDNENVTDVDVSKASHLTGLNVYDTKIQTLDLSQNKHLIDLYAYGSRMSQLTLCDSAQYSYINLERCAFDLATLHALKQNENIEDLYLGYQLLETRSTGTSKLIDLKHDTIIRETPTTITVRIGDFDDETPAAEGVDYILTNDTVHFLKNGNYAIALSHPDITDNGNPVFVVIPVWTGTHAPAVDTLRFKVLVNDPEERVTFQFGGKVDNWYDIHWGDRRTDDVYYRDNDGYEASHEYDNPGEYEVMLVGDYEDARIEELELHGIFDYETQQKPYEITSLDVSKAPFLVTLVCEKWPKLESVDLSNNLFLENVNLNGNRLTTLNLSGLSNLHKLDAGYNQLTSIDLRGMNLDEGYFNDNKIAQIQYNEQTHVEYIRLEGNALSLPALREIAPKFTDYDFGQQILPARKTDLGATVSFAADTILFDDEPTRISANKLLVMPADTNDYQIGADSISLAFLNNGLYYAVLEHTLAQVYVPYEVGELAPQEISFTTTAKTLINMGLLLTLTPVSVDWGDGNTETVHYFQDGIALNHAYTDNLSEHTVNLKLQDGERPMFVNFEGNELTSLDFSKAPDLAGVALQNTKIKTLDFSQNTKIESVAAYDNPQLSSVIFADSANVTQLMLPQNALSWHEISKLYTTVHSQQYNFEWQILPYRQANANTPIGFGADTIIFKNHPVSVEVFRYNAGTLTEGEDYTLSGDSITFLTTGLIWLQIFNDSLPDASVIVPFAVDENIPSKEEISFVVDNSDYASFSMTMQTDEPVTIDWGDGNTETEDGNLNYDFSHSYLNEGVYTVTLKSESENNPIESFTMGYATISELTASKAPSLKELIADNVQLQHVDLSANTKLEWLQLQENQLTEIDLSACKNLKNVLLEKNQLTSLTINGLTQLQEFYANNNRLTLKAIHTAAQVLDSCKDLTTVDFTDQRLPELTVGLREDINPEQYTAGFQAERKTLKDNGETAELHVDYDNVMGCLQFFKDGLYTLQISAPNAISYPHNVNVPVIAGNPPTEQIRFSGIGRTMYANVFTTNGGAVSIDYGNGEADTVSDLNFTVFKRYNQNELHEVVITALSPTTTFVALYFDGTKMISQLDVTAAPSLQTLYCDYEALTSLDLSQSKNLNDLDYSYNYLPLSAIWNIFDTTKQEQNTTQELLPRAVKTDSVVDLSNDTIIRNGKETNITVLKYVGSSYELAEIDVDYEMPENVKIKFLEDGIYRVDLSNDAIEGDAVVNIPYYVTGNTLESLTFTVENMDYVFFDDAYDGAMTVDWGDGTTSYGGGSDNYMSHDYATLERYEITVSAKAIKEFTSRYTNMVSLDVSNAQSLRVLACDNNLLESIDLSQNSNLEQLICWNNRLSMPELGAIIDHLPDDFDLDDNAFIFPQNMENRITAQNTPCDVNSDMAAIGGTPTRFQIVTGANTDAVENTDYTFNTDKITFLKDGMYFLRLSNDALPQNSDEDDNYVQIPFVVGNVPNDQIAFTWEKDAGEGGYFTVETQNKRLVVNWGDGTTDTVTYEGEHEYAAKGSYTVTLTALSAGTMITELYNLYDENLSALDVSKAPYLKEIYCGGNNMTTLDVSNNHHLQDLDVEYGKLTDIQFGDVKIQTLYATNNQLTLRTMRRIHNTNIKTDAYGDTDDNFYKQEFSERKVVINDVFDLTNDTIIENNEPSRIKVLKTQNGVAATTADYTLSGAQITFKTVGAYTVEIRNDEFYDGHNNNPFVTIPFVVEYSGNALLAELTVSPVNGRDNVETGRAPSPQQSVVRGNVETLRATSSYAMTNTVETRRATSLPNRHTDKGRHSALDAESPYNKGIAGQARNDERATSIPLTPTFNPETFEYTVNVPYETPAIEITAIAQHANAQINGTGEKPLTVGENTFEIIVTAQDKVSIATYVVKVTRAEQSTNANLKNLTVETWRAASLQLTPVFDSMTTNYTVTVADTVSSITITATKSHNLASVSGDGEKSLNTGTNPFDIEVTAQSGAKKIYTVTVTRQNPTGIVGALRATPVQVYPNPVTDVLYIQTNDLNVPDVKIYTLNGTLVMQAKTTELNVSHLPQGVYVVYINGQEIKVVKR